MILVRVCVDPNPNEQRCSPNIKPESSAVIHRRFVGS
jgi:hypothetical protein